MNKAYNLYLKEHERLLKSHNDKLETALIKARDKQHTLRIIEGQFHQYFRKSEQTLINANLHNFFKTFEETLSMDSSLSDADAFKTSFRSCESEFNKENAILLATHKAFIDFKKAIRLKQEIMSNKDKPTEKLETKYWIGTESTEFVQLMYGLIEAKKLQNNNIVHMIEDVANFMGITLSKNWQSNKSSSIHNRNNDYEPSIFNDLKNGWERYASKMEAKKRKSKNK
jgi:hypothetical protein